VTLPAFFKKQKFDWQLLLKNVFFLTKKKHFEKFACDISVSIFSNFQKNVENDCAIYSFIIREEPNLQCSPDPYAKIFILSDCCQKNINHHKFVHSNQAAKTLTGKYPRIYTISMDFSFVGLIFAPNKSNIKKRGKVFVII